MRTSRGRLPFFFGGFGAPGPDRFNLHPQTADEGGAGPCVGRPQEEDMRYGSWMRPTQPILTVLPIGIVADSGARRPAAPLMNEAPKSQEQGARRKRRRESSLCFCCCAAFCFQLVFTTVSAVLIALDAKFEPDSISLEISSMRPPEAAIDLSSVVRWRKLPWANGLSSSAMVCELLNATTGAVPFASLTLWPISIDQRNGFARPTITLEVAPACRLTDLLNSWVLAKDTANARVGAVHRPQGCMHRTGCLLHSCCRSRCGCTARRCTALARSRYGQVLYTCPWPLTSLST